MLIRTARATELRARNVKTYHIKRRSLKISKLQKRDLCRCFAPSAKSENLRNAKSQIFMFCVMHNACALKISKVEIALCSYLSAICSGAPMVPSKIVESIKPVSYTHLTLPTIYSV